MPQILNFLKPTSMFSAYCLQNYTTHATPLPNNGPMIKVQIPRKTFYFVKPANCINAKNDCKCISCIRCHSTAV